MYIITYIYNIYIYVYTQICIYNTCVKNVSESARKCCPVIELASGSDGSKAIDTSSIYIYTYIYTDMHIDTYMYIHIYTCISL